MAAPVYVAGQVLTAADCNGWFTGPYLIKGSDTSRSSNTTPTADPDLVMPVVANATYWWECRVVYNGGTNGSSDGQFGFSAPAGATGFYESLRNQVSGLTWGNALATSYGTQANVGTNGTGNPISYCATGIVIVSSTAGNLSFFWAQNTSSGTATTVKAGSLLVGKRIG